MKKAKKEGKWEEGGSMGGFVSEERREDGSE